MAQKLKARSEPLKGGRGSLCGLTVLLATAATLAGCASQPATHRVVINQTAVRPVPTLEAARVDRGEELYAQHCSNCHGANLEGAPDWKRPLADGSYPPPPHDDSGHTWHHPDELLQDIIAHGGDPAYNSKMPALDVTLSPDEIASVLDFIKCRWATEAREFQWWISATWPEP